MKVIAVVPARGGSKRVPGKNIRPLAGKPLLAWSIGAARSSKHVTRVVVSTDDPEIAEVAATFGAEPIMRPPEASTEDAPIEAALWSVHQAVRGDYDYMVTLQPTVPLRRQGLIDECIERAVYLDADAVFTARVILRCWLWEETTGHEWAEHMAWARLGSPLQRQQATWRDRLHMHDGSVCVSTRGIIQARRDRTGGRAHPFPNDAVIDIDTEADFAAAEAVMRQALEGVPA